MPQLFYPQGKNLQYQLDRRLSGPQSQFGHCGEEKNLFPPLGTEPKFFGCSVHGLRYFSSLTLQPQFRPWPTFMKLSVSLQFSRP
jgi:hypothetical protein